MNTGFHDENMARQQEKLAATSDMAVQRRFMLELLALKRGERVLDLGSGNGIFAREMLAKVGDEGEVQGVDNAEVMVRLASALCPDAVFAEGDATNLPVEDSTFDAVTTSQVLCFVDDVPAALDECFRVLKPGGRLVILDSDWDSLVWNCRDRALMNRVIAMLTEKYADPHVPRKLTRLLEKAGFQITDRRSFAVLNWELRDDSYARQTVGFIEKMMEASDEFSDEDWRKFDEDQKAVAQAGEYMFSLNRYVFKAIKP